MTRPPRPPADETPQPMKLRPFMDVPHEEDCPVCLDQTPRDWSDCLGLLWLMAIWALIGLGLWAIDVLSRVGP